MTDAANTPSPQLATDDRPIWERLAELAEKVPQSELDKLPRDGAAQHDHYLYGSPKRPDNNPMTDAANRPMEERLSAIAEGRLALDPDKTVTADELRGDAAQQRVRGRMFVAGQLDRAANTLSAALSRATAAEAERDAANRSALQHARELAETINVYAVVERDRDQWKARAESAEKEVSRYEAMKSEQVSELSPSWRWWKSRAEAAEMSLSGRSREAHENYFDLKARAEAAEKRAGELRGSLEFIVAVYNSEHSNDMGSAISQAEAALSAYAAAKEGKSDDH